VTVEADAHQVKSLTLVPIRSRPDGNDAGHRLPVLYPELNADDRRPGAECE
jgi:hypothetical protein